MSKSSNPGATGEKDELTSYLQELDSWDFEKFLADLWERQGWETEITAKSQDAGIDVIASRTHPVPLKIVIQAKRYGPSSTVSSIDIQQYAALQLQEDNVDAVAVITTGGFSDQAGRIAEELDVKLVDLDDLCEMIRDMEAHDLLNPYIDASLTPPGQPPAGEEVLAEDIGHGFESSELEGHVLDGTGLTDTVPAERYDHGESLLLVHTSSDRPIRLEAQDREPLGSSVGESEEKRQVYLHLTTECIRIFVRDTEEDAAWSTTHDAVVEAEAETALFGPSESIVIELKDGETIEYTFRSMRSELRERFERILSDRAGVSISL